MKKIPVCAVAVFLFFKGMALGLTLEEVLALGELPEAEQQFELTKVSVDSENEFIELLPELIAAADDEFAVKAMDVGFQIVVMSHEHDPDTETGPVMEEMMWAQTRLKAIARGLLESERTPLRELAIKFLLSRNDEGSKKILVRDLNLGEGKFSDPSYIVYLAGDENSLRALIDSPIEEIQKKSLSNAAVYTNLAPMVSEKWLNPDVSDEVAVAAADALSTYAPETFSSVSDIVVFSGDRYSQLRKAKAAEFIAKSFIQLDKEQVERLSAEPRLKMVIDEYKISGLDDAANLLIQAAEQSPLRE